MDLSTKGIVFLIDDIANLNPINNHNKKTIKKISISCSMLVILDFIISNILIFYIIKIKTL